MTRIITAMFDSRAAADAAADQLVREIGIQRSAIQIHGGEDMAGRGAAGAASAGASSGQTYETGGFWSALRDLFVPDEDRHTYVEGIRRGGCVVTAQVDDTKMERAMDVLEANGAVDLDSREAEWRAGGWSGQVASLPTSPETGVAGTTHEKVVERPGGAGGDFTTNPAPGLMDSKPDTTRRTGDKGTAASGTPPAGVSPGATVGGAGMGHGMAGVQGTATRTASGTAAAATAGTMPVSGTDEVIPMVEERIQVGKRDVERGRVRVRSYVVEQPVSEQVTLHSEHVEVRRREVDRPAEAGDDLFRERTIEAVEHAEEAVVSKEARVTEEVVLHKEASDRTETVKGTVRHTEVEVDDGMAAKGGAKRTPASGPGRDAGGTADGSPGNPPGTMASRAADKALGTDLSDRNKTRKP